MTLYDKIMKLYPGLSSDDFMTTIILQNDGDSNGDYIRMWTHPTYTEPTPTQLASVV